jgi:hypothetical protein
MVCPFTQTAEPALAAGFMAKANSSPAATIFNFSHGLPVHPDSIAITTTWAKD